jgi:beta-N-acetylhexosaminidase
VAQQAATLISPALADLPGILPEPPNINDRILFISDVSSAKQCSDCPETEDFSVRTLEDAVLRLYGPSAGGQVLQRNLNSYSFDDLLAVLDHTPQTDFAALETEIQEAQWLVFAMLSVRTNDPPSQAFSRFLAERPDLFRQKNLVVFSFDAPYYLDVTEISKLSAYYGLYSRIPQFVEVAARLLFGEIPAPPGKLPVSMSGVDYDLISATAPDPSQTIQLSLDIPRPSLPTPQPAEAPQFGIGDLIPVKTEIISDHNGHQVPDGTPVQFILNLGVTEISSQTVETEAGIGRTTFLIEQPGTYEITARSDPAFTSNIIQVNVSPDRPVVTQGGPIITPTEVPTEQPTESPTPALEITPSPPEFGPTDMGDWLLAAVLTAGLSVSIYWLTATLGLMRWGIRAGLIASIGSLLAYGYLALDLPGSTKFLDSAGSWGVVAVTALGAGLGWIISLGWHRYQNNLKEKISAH